MKLDFTQEEEQVFKALENPKYEWRTIDGIVKETGLSEDEVIKIIKKFDGLIIKSSIPSIDGKSLFTTRSKFRKKQPVFKQVYSIFKNRAD